MINAILKPADLVVSTRADSRGFLGARVTPQNYMSLVAEMEGVLSALLFPEAPPVAHRTQLMAELVGTGVINAMYIVEYLHRSLQFEGDVCEFGVAQGATSAFLANEIRDTGKTLWLFDSFEGLPKPGDKDQLIDDIFNLESIEKYEGTMACPSEMVKARLRAISFPLSRVKIVPGFIEKTIAGPSLPAKVSFAYVDFDFYNPILVALKFLDKHLSVGGHVVVDDYGFFSAGAKAAVDEFAHEHKDTFELLHPPEFAGHFCIFQKKAES
jgi:O-methyltransferase